MSHHKDLEEREKTKSSEMEKNERSEKKEIAKTKDSIQKEIQRTAIMKGNKSNYCHEQRHDNRLAGMIDDNR